MLPGPSSSRLPIGMTQLTLGSVPFRTSRINTLLGARFCNRDELFWNDAKEGNGFIASMSLKFPPFAMPAYYFHEMPLLSSSSIMTGKLSLGFCTFPVTFPDCPAIKYRWLGKLGPITGEKKLSIRTNCEA